MDLKFPVDALDMCADRRRTHRELRPHLFVKIALGQPVEDLRFAGGKIWVVNDVLLARPRFRPTNQRGGGESLPVKRHLSKSGDDLAGNLAGDGRSTGMKLLNGFNNFARRTGFQKISRRARAQGAEDTAVVLNHGQHHELGLWQECGDNLQAINAAHARKLYVEENHIRFEVWESRDRIFAVPGGSDALHPVGVVQDVNERLERFFVIFNNGNANRTHQSFTITKYRDGGKYDKLRTGATLCL